MYTLSLALLIVSCRSVNKMVEKGEYDKAFDYSVAKLSGAKNKKTEYVKALEKAYDRLTKSSLREINRLSDPSKPQNYPKIHDLYKGIMDRQDRIDPLLPLVSEDGYTASFDMKDYSKEMSDAEENMCAYLYNHALNLMAKTDKTGDRLHAREAYGDLTKILSYRSSYKDADRQVEKALQMGTTRVDIRIFNDLRDFMSYNIERSISELPVSRLDDRWTDYRIAVKGNDKSDYTVWLDLEHISFSPERERTNTYSETKEVLLKKEKVKERRDSVDVWVEKEVFEKVRADITEVFREKQSELHGRMRVTDNRNGEVIRTVPINVLHDFKGYGCRYTGDERALTQGTKNKLDNNLEYFPADGQMADNLANAFKDAVMGEIRKLRL